MLLLPPVVQAGWGRLQTVVLPGTVAQENRAFALIAPKMVILQGGICRRRPAYRTPRSAAGLYDSTAARTPTREPDWPAGARTEYGAGGLETILRPPRRQPVSVRRGKDLPHAFHMLWIAEIDSGIAHVEFQPAQMKHGHTAIELLQRIRLERIEAAESSQTSGKASHFLREPIIFGAHERIVIGDLTTRIAVQVRDRQEHGALDSGRIQLRDEVSGRDRRDLPHPRSRRAHDMLVVGNLRNDGLRLPGGN